MSSRTKDRLDITQVIEYPTEHPTGPLDDWDLEPDTAAHKLIQEEIDALIDSSGEHKALLIAMSGMNIGKTLSLGDGVTTVGRGKDCTIVIDDDSVSRNHAEIVRLPDGNFEIRDKDSTNGTFVGKKRVRRQVIHDGDRIVFGMRAVYKMAFQDTLEQSYQHVLYSSSVRDALTNAYNRKHLTERLRADFSYCRRHSQPLSLLIVDVDRFKQVNDNYSHQTGDTVLKGVTDAILNLIRTEDILGRYGGEEFAIIAPGTGYEGATLMGERIRAAIAQLDFTSNDDQDVKFKITVSIGVVTVTSPSFSSPEEIFAAADTNLYRAKNEGRNRVKASLQYL